MISVYAVWAICAAILFVGGLIAYAIERRFSKDGKDYWQRTCRDYDPSGDV